MKSDKKKDKDAPISEEITITHNINYYNDSLENDPNFGIENENEDNKNKENGVDEIIEIKKEITNKEKKDSNEKVENSDIKKAEEKAIKIHYKNSNYSKNDKTSSCHIIFHIGVDIDISSKTIFECYELVNKNNFLLFKKDIKIKTLIFLEEQYIYLLKDILINNNNEKLRRIFFRYDLNKLFDYSINKKENKYLFKLEFLKDDNFFERNNKLLLFEENEGEKFEEYLIEVLEKIDATFLDEIFEQNEDDDDDDEEEEEEEEEKVEKKKNLKNDKKNINENKILQKNEDKGKKDKIFIKNNLEGKDLNLKISTSRDFLK